MKTTFSQISLIAAIVFSAFTTVGQTNNSISKQNNDYAYNGLAKIDPNLSATGTPVATESVSNKIAKSFKKYFGEQAEQNWSIVGNNFLNRFHVNGVLTNSMFDKNGNLIYTIRYGTEQDMPEDVKRIVKSEYYDYSITMAVNVNESKRDIWVVTLVNATQQLTVRVEDGDMEQVQEINISK